MPPTMLQPGGDDDWFMNQGIQGYGGNTGVTGGMGAMNAPVLYADPGNGGGLGGYGEPGGARGGMEAMPGPMVNTTAQPQSQNVGHDGTFNGMNREQYRDAWMSSGVNSVEGMKDWIGKNGGQWMADNGTVMTPFGEALDMGFNARGSAAGNGQLKPTWGGGGGDVGAGVPLNAIGVGSGATAAAMASGAGGGGRGAGSPGATGVAWNGQIKPFEYQDFQAPDPSQVANDPGYQFRLKQGLDVANRMASKNHLLRSGNTMTALNDYASGMASQEYGNAYQRALTANQANNAGRLGQFQAQTGADLGYGNLDLGYTNAGNQYALGLGNLALGNKSADQSYDLGLRNNALGYTQAGNSMALGMGNLGLGWANYGLNAQGQQFNQGYSLANLGLQAAGQVGNYGSQYGAAGTNAITGRGNATAAGQAGAGAAWGNFLGNTGGTLMGYGIDQLSNRDPRVSSPAPRGTY